MHTHTHTTHTQVYIRQVFQLSAKKQNRGYTDAAGKPKSLVRKCSELNSIDVSNRNDKLYVELTGNDDRSQSNNDNGLLVIIMIMIIMIMIIMIMIIMIMIMIIMIIMIMIIMIMMIMIMIIMIMITI
jgi:hypothetical protein